MSPNVYADAIDIIITLKDDDYKKLIIIIAKHIPSAIVKSYKRLNLNSENIAAKNIYSSEKWYNDIFVLLKNNKPMDAIRNLRSTTGKGLKDSKEIIDLIRKSEGILF